MTVIKDRKTKTLIYKRAEFQQTGGNDLQTRIAGALAKFKTIGQRRESVALVEESPTWRLIGQFKPETGFIFGVLTRYSPGLNPLFLVDDPSKPALSMQQMAAPKTADGKARELVEGMLFFGVSGNHMVMMQSSSLRSKHLEDHCIWLLRQAGLLAERDTLQLVDQPPRATLDRLAQAPVREIDLGGAIVAPADGGGASGDSRSASHSVALTGDGLSEKLRQALQSLLPRADARRLDLAELEASNIHYTLKIRYDHKTNDNGQRVMNALGSALRHADDVDARVGLVGGGELLKNELKLTGSVRVDTYDGVPSPEEVFGVMRQWLNDKLQSGEAQAR